MIYHQLIADSQKLITAAAKLSITNYKLSITAAGGRV